MPESVYEAILIEYLTRVRGWITEHNRWYKQGQKGSWIDIDVMAFDGESIWIFQVKSSLKSNEVEKIVKGLKKDERFLKDFLLQRLSTTNLSRTSRIRKIVVTNRPEGKQQQKKEEILTQNGIEVWDLWAIVCALIRKIREDIGFGKEKYEPRGSEIYEAMRSTIQALHDGLGTSNEQEKFRQEILTRNRLSNSEKAKIEIDWEWD